MPPFFFFLNIYKYQRVHCDSNDKDTRSKSSLTHFVVNLGYYQSVSDIVYISEVVLALVYDCLMQYYCQVLQKDWKSGMSLFLTVHFANAVFENSNSFSLLSVLSIRLLEKVLLLPTFISVIVTLAVASICRVFQLLEKGWNVTPLNLNLKTDLVSYCFLLIAFQAATKWNYWILSLV